MIVILGASGKVGCATIARLRAANQPVRAVLHRPDYTDEFRRLGCEVVIADIADRAALHAAFSGANQVQVICPVAGQAAAAAEVMHQSIDQVAEALLATKPDHVLAISDYGAEQETGTGITLVFRYLEAVLRQLPAKLTLLRSAEQMQNWGRVVAVAACDGVLPSFHHPLDKLFPTVAAQDVGAIAAEFLIAPPMSGQRIIHVEGPRRYAAFDVAAILTELLDRWVRAMELPPQEWRSVLTRAGLSDSYADLVVDLFTAHNAGRIDAELAAGPVRHGTTELKDVLAGLLPRTS